MGKFIYKFETVKNVKKTIEKKVQKEISLIEKEINKLLTMLSKLEYEKSENRSEMLKKVNLKVSELKFYSNFESYIEQQGKRINEKILSLERQKEKKRDELKQKSKETKIFEKLEEKHLESFTITQNKLEQIEIDDIATKNFLRGSL